MTGNALEILLGLVTFAQYVVMAIQRALMQLSCYLNMKQGTHSRLQTEVSKSVKSGILKSERLRLLIRLSYISRCF